MTYNLWNIFLIFIAFSGIIKGALVPSHKLEEITDLATDLQTTNYGTFVSDIVDFEDGTFIHLYIDQTSQRIQAQITENGAQKYLIPDISDTVLGYQAQGISGCRFGENQILTVYSIKQIGTRRNIALRLIDKDGTVGNEIMAGFTPYAHDQWMARCVQLDSQTLGITFYAYDKENPQIQLEDTGVYYQVYKPYLGNTLSSPIQVNQYTDGFQRYQDISLLKGTSKGVITFRSEQNANGPVIGLRDSTIFYQFVNPDGTLEGLNVEIPEAYEVTDGINHQMSPVFNESTDDGGFGVVFGTKEGDIKFARFNKLGEKQCLETISTGKKQNPSLAIHKDKAYIACKDYTETNLATINSDQGFVYEIQLSDCTRINEIEFTNVSTDVKYTPWVAVTEGPIATILGLSFQVAPSSLNYVEFFIEQNGTCTIENCNGCYGSTIGDCKICPGSTVANQLIRIGLAPTDCVCPDNYYEDENLDCILCTGIYYKNSSGVCKTCLPGCASCSNGYSCDVCLDTDTNIDLQCSCPAIFYTDSFGVCQECQAQCQSCSNGNGCDTCKDTDMIIESNCLYRKSGNLLSISTDGSLVVQSCHKKCENCVEFYDNCDGCAGKNRENDSGCRCLESYHDFAGQLQDCEKCPELCSACQSPYVCTACTQGFNRYLNTFSGQCECMMGFISFGDSQECVKCYQVSDGCVQSCPSNTIQNEKTQICEPLSYSLNSNMGSIIVFGLLIAFIQIGLCVGLYFLIQKRYNQFQTAYLETQMKLKQQREFIYKDLENLNNNDSSSYNKLHQNSNIDTSQPGVSSIQKPKKRGRAQRDQSLQQGRQNMDNKSNMDKSVDDLMDEIGQSQQQLVSQQHGENMEDIIA